MKGFNKMTKHQKGLLVASIPFILASIVGIAAIIWGANGAFFSFIGLGVMAMLSTISVGLYNTYVDED